MSHAVAFTAKDFESDQEIRWCPGCGDYSILAQMKKVLPTLGLAPEQIGFVSGIATFFVVRGILRARSREARE